MGNLLIVIQCMKIEIKTHQNILALSLCLVCGMFLEFLAISAGFLQYSSTLTLSLYNSNNFITK